MQRKLRKNNNRMRGCDGNSETDVARATCCDVAVTLDTNGEHLDAGEQYEYVLMQ